MKITKFLPAFLLVAFALPLSAQWTLQVQPYLNGEGTEKGSDVFVAYGFKTKSDYSISVETLMNVADKDGAKHVTYNHEYSRIGFKSPVSYELGSGWKLNFQYRYILPTTLTAQAEGNYGTASFRPTVTNSFGGFLNLSLRTIVALDLQREAYQMNPPAGATTAAANRLFALGEEIIPEFVLTEGLTFTPVLAVVYGYVMAPPHGGVTASNKLEFNPELSYVLKSVDENLSVSIWYDEVAAFGTGKDLEFFESSQSKYGIGATYTFQ
jgi:hypothetical protein